MKILALNGIKAINSAVTTINVVHPSPNVKLDDANFEKDLSTFSLKERTTYLEFWDNMQKLNFWEGQLIFLIPFKNQVSYDMFIEKMKTNYKYYDVKKITPTKKSRSRRSLTSTEINKLEWVVTILDSYAINGYYSTQKLATEFVATGGSILGFIAGGPLGLVLGVAAFFSKVANLIYQAIDNAWTPTYILLRDQMKELLYKAKNTPNYDETDNNILRRNIKKLVDDNYSVFGTIKDGFYNSLYDRPELSYYWDYSDYGS